MSQRLQCFLEYNIQKKKQKDKKFIKYNQNLLFSQMKRKINENNEGGTFFEVS